MSALSQRDLVIILIPTYAQYAYDPKVLGKINRKVHKKVKGSGRHPTRVYISGIGTPTEGIAVLVEEELRQGVEDQESYPEKRLTKSF